jgi:hypothetical protein
MPTAIAPKEPFDAKGVLEAQELTRVDEGADTTIELIIRQWEKESSSTGLSAMK